MTNKTITLTNWSKKNKLLLLMTVFIYQVSILAIGLVNFPYIDDTARQITGATDFAKSYSRWASEIASWLVQGSRHLTDMGLTTHIITGLILALTSIIVVYCLNDQKLALLPLITSTIIGLNPWFLQSISFRFDSPYMALSILFSVIPFLWWNKKTTTFALVSIISIFLMCNTYQASSGIYIVMVLALSLKDILAGQAHNSVLNKVFFSAASYILAMFIYLVETKLNPELANRGEHVVIAKLGDIPKTILVNSQMYLNQIFEQSTKLWLALFVTLILVFISISVLSSKISRVKSLLFILLYLVLGAILSYGVFLIFPEKLALVSPRYAYGFAIFGVVTLILLQKYLARSIVSTFTRIIICVFCYYMLSFPFIYASTLQYQKDAFQRQSMTLADTLKDLVSSDTKSIHSDTLFRDSPILINSVRNFPILKDLVPSNSAIYWPNQLLFKTYTGMNFTIFPFNARTTNFEPNDLKVSNYYYKIYEKDQNLYIIMNKA